MSDGRGEFVCPYYTQLSAVSDPQPQQMVACPHCGGEFCIPEIDRESTETGAPINDQLDAARIAQLTRMRRATYRSRSYAIIAAAACCVAVAKLGVMLIREVMLAGFGFWPIAYILGAAGAVYGAWRMIGRAMALNREMSRSLSTTHHAAEPDFSQLSDGSQHAGNLEQIR